MEFWLILSIIANLTLIFICRNLYQKNIAYEEFIIQINNKIIEAINNMRMVDSSGVFEADDEVGSTFKSLLQIVNELEGLINVEEEKEE